MQDRSAAIASQPADRDVASRDAGVLVSGGGGFAILAGFAALAAVLAWAGLSSHGWTMVWLLAASTVAVVAMFVSMAGFVTIRPYERLVVSLFGRYVGVERREGLGWIVPLYSTQRVSTALSNFESETIKVNDHSGNPVVVKAVIVYRVSDAAKSVYLVSNVGKYVAQQMVAALRALAAKYDYDDIAPKVALEGTDLAEAARTTPHTLRGNVEEVAAELKTMVQKQIGDIGVEIVEARIVMLAYASESAGAMLRKQQAVALLAARETIVEGAVGIVEKAIESLKNKGLTLDEDRRATIAGNLLVVIASERDASPVVPLGVA